MLLMDTGHFVCPFFCLFLLAIMNITAINIHVQFFCVNMFSFIFG